jgi:SNF2 family DNA or RNA helicase
MELSPFQRNDCIKYFKAGGGLCGSEMGTGKTLIGVTCDQWWGAPKYNKEGLPTLVVCPINTFDGWIKIYGELAPELSVRVVVRTEGGRADWVADLKAKKHDVYIINYDSLRVVEEDGRGIYGGLRDVRFCTIIADEVHRISNRKARITQCLFRLGRQSRHRLALSGTASGDRPENLWSILHWLWPRVYTSYWKFRRWYVEEMVGYGGYRSIVGYKNLDHLHNQMEPFYSRHLKREQCCEEHPNGVMSELPEKTYQKIWVDLNPTQRRVYDQMKKEMVAWIGEHEGEPLMAGAVVAQLARLSQIALATPTFGADGTVELTLPSGKLDALLEILQDNPDKKFVVFSSSKKMVYLCAKELEGKGIGSFVLSGDTPAAQRTGMVERFRTAAPSECQVFMAVIEAGGEGIDGLQHCTDTAIFLDRSWRTIKNQQAEDRLHRGGQRDTVLIIDIMARDTLDMGRLTRLQAKWSAIKAILGDNLVRSA